MKKLIILAFVILIMASSAFAWDIVSRKMQATDEYGGTLTVWLTVSGTTVVKRIEIAHASAKKLSKNNPDIRCCYLVYDVRDRRGGGASACYRNGK